MKSRNVIINMWIERTAGKDCEFGASVFVNEIDKF